jgi:hypothetical protein
MGVSPATVSALIEDELAKLGDRRVVEHIRGLLIPPQLQTRSWDYGAPGDTYPCWLVLAHRASNTGMAYSEFGFGPEMPWGLLFLDEHTSMGMDSGWFAHFLDAYFDSMASSELPIWRVFQHQGGDFPGTPITGEKQLGCHLGRSRAPAGRFPRLSLCLLAERVSA